jgi:DNA-binding response OmpR family regulator
LARPATIAVAEDEADLLEAIAEYLSVNGYRVFPAADGAAFRAIFEREEVDLAIIDIALPKEDGLSLARWLSARGNVGVILATASGGMLDRVLGLELGADDYLVKPYEMRELLARVRSLMRRLPAKREGAAPEAAMRPASGRPRLPVGPLSLDVVARRLLRASGEEVPLTTTEFDLLKVLAEHPHRTLSREELLELTHSTKLEPDDRSIDVRITRLRGKIEPDPSRPQIIRTVRGEGYVFIPDGRLG